ncbi:hypothetical protein BN903_14 [Halorubrum sp. AJ67]|nr:hypothetical protein BN903_14 [Halorubrum sp. AJ67]
MHVRPTDIEVVERVLELVERGADLDELLVGVGTADAGGATHRFFIQGEFGHGGVESVSSEPSFTARRDDGAPTVIGSFEQTLIQL